MAPYIMALFQITMQSMESATESVILQGIEFWSSVAETEEELIELREEAERISDEPPQEVSQQYAQGAQAKLVPIILRLMEQQDEGGFRYWSIPARSREKESLAKLVGSG